MNASVGFFLHFFAYFFFYIVLFFFFFFVLQFFKCRHICILYICKTVVFFSFFSFRSFNSTTKTYFCLVLTGSTHRSTSETFLPLTPFLSLPAPLLPHIIFFFFLFSLVKYFVQRNKLQPVFASQKKRHDGETANV